MFQLRLKIIKTAIRHNESIKYYYADLNFQILKVTIIIRKLLS